MANTDGAARRGRVLRHPADARQLLIVAIYLGSIFGMYFVPAMRHVLVLGVAFAFSFFTMLVAHNHLHQSIFVSRRLDRAFRLVLSFCALYPISTNVPAHNLVHHRFQDEGQIDWADPSWVSFRWNLLNLLHFPNAIGTVGIAGTRRFMLARAGRALRGQYLREQIFAFGLTGVLLAWDPWAALFYVVLPQLWGARSILRLNLLQHDGCDLSSRWNHSRNFVGRVLNWFMCNNGLHTIHHDRPGLHWSQLREHHEREIAPHIDPRLDQRSLLVYVVRAYLLGREPRTRDIEARTRCPGLPDLDARPEKPARRAALEEAHA